MTDAEITEAAARHGPLLAGVVRFLNAIASFCMLVAGVQLVTLIAIFGWLVFGRYVLNDTPTWVEQVSLLLVVWITFLGGAAGVWRGTHLGVDFLREALPALPRWLLQWIAILMMIIFGSFMARQGYLLAAGTWKRQIPMLDIAEGWRSVPMAICGVLTVVFSLTQLVLFTADRARAPDIGSGA